MVLALLTLTQAALALVGGFFKHHLLEEFQ